MRTVILGGGMAGLTAAHTLAAHRDLCIVQRGWRLGGKGASHRGVNGRIEEHGLHVWLGYYDNAFRLMREVYEHLDREAADPACPIKSWRDAFMPSNVVVVFDRHDGEWAPWVAQFRPNALVPGHPSDGTSVAELVRRGAALLADLVSSLGWVPPRRGVAPDRLVSLSARAPGARTGATAGERLRELSDLTLRTELAALVAAVQVQRALSTVGLTQSGRELTDLLVDAFSEARLELHRRLRRDRQAARLWQAVDLVATALIGIYNDRLLDRDRGYAAINHLDFREWLARHGADAFTLESGLIRGMYDLVFAYRDGDRTHPAFEAGTGLQLAGRFFFDYKGSLFWKMRAGMGDVVFAPLYQSLRQRGAEFKFFHRLQRLRLNDAGTRVEAIELARQARTRPEVAQYNPLVRVNGLPCFPDRPSELQLEPPLPTVDVESHFADRSTEEVVTLRYGQDFDEVVLAVSLGMIPFVCGELIDADVRWRQMVTNVRTVATKSFQVWTTKNEQEMGWAHPGSTSAGFEGPYDTYASMPHLSGAEGWRAEGPATVSYFCSALPESDSDPQRAAEYVERQARTFLDCGTSYIWPKMSTREDGFQWKHVHGFYARANVDPSDRYVQSLPGSSVYRLAADESGFSNLFLAGDWVDSGLNAGCIEAAVVSGIQAANALLARPVDHGLFGGWTPTRTSLQT